MEWYVHIKTLHISSAILTVSLLFLRLALDAMNKPDWRKSWLKRLPHINDTLLLSSAIFLLVITGWNPLQHVWLGVKLLLVLGYIVSGWFALKTSLRTRFRVTAAILCLVQVSAIFLLATTKPF